MNFLNYYKNIINFKDIKIKYFFLFLVIFLPKIDLYELPIPGVNQAPRIEEIILIFFCISLFFPKKNFFLVWSDKFIFKNWIVFFSLIMFFNIIHILNGKNINLLILFRIFEYVVVIIFLNNLLTSKNIYFVMKSFTLINFVIALLQILNLVGSISSIGFLPAEHILNQRAYGILGGSWELGIVSGMLSLAFFRGRNQIKFFWVYMLINTINLFLAYGITNLIAYTISISLIFFIFIMNKLIKYPYKFIIISLLLCLVAYQIIYFFNLSDLILTFFKNNPFLKRMSNIDFIYLYNVYMDYFRSGYIPDLKDVKDPMTHYSIIIRLETWQNSILQFQNSNLSKFIGVGLNELYLESIIIRIITGFGIIGCFFIFYAILNVPLYFLLFIIVSGINIDLFISIKIFIFTFIFFKVNQLAENGKNII